ncbi:enoyl-CoA hydratase-related protein [Leptospira sarikeiensis]|uniref:Enoyl-CoA hydratase n=1 Tax=Leptospira sarikeiensis TaxID=2484943 RepID=A0A4R9K0Y0_9LEPT|nr:enoyl-CoA hydratase-related protein [Leptospira sarikeiensis]TGL58362.1 enoyl-CoA hydratase [Leptospira sarikeiensis]
MSELPLITKIHPVPGGQIFEIIMNRSEVHNAVNKEMADLFLEAWKTFQKNDELTVAILYGAGDKAFCSGADLSGLERLANFYLNDQQKEEYSKNDPGPLGGSRLIQKKPVITVSHGYTYAGGLELFCHGHIRIAEPQAIFSVACRRWGVPLIDGGTVYLPRLLGWGAALPLILTGQRIRAERAYQLGLVWELTKKGKGLERAFSYATQLCRQPKDAMFADLGSAIDGWSLSVQDALILEAKNTYPVMESKSTKEGVQKFLDGDRFWFR